MKNMIECENLVKIYKTDEIEVVALQGLDLTVAEGEMMAIIGSSGSGKSTLLNMLGGLDTPSAGKLSVDGKNLLAMNEHEKIIYKRDTVGFVWQNNARNLIPWLTALDNVQLPMMVSGAKDKKERAQRLLDMVGMSHRVNNTLSELSGGEQQRVAIAIGLANHPPLLLADEPTGEVDTRTAARILDLFREVCREMGTTVVIVTHDRQVSHKVDRVIAIRDGRISSEFVRKRSYLEEYGGGDFFSEESHEELVVVDRVGRLQLPEEYVRKMGLHGRDRVRVEMEDDAIVIRRTGEPD
jgi:ABC-type lipoprotein export system ATPase subunit